MSDNPINDYNAYQAKQDKAISRYPICDKCHEPIQDETYYVIHNDNICQNCLDSLYRVSNDFGEE